MLQLLAADFISRLPLWLGKSIYFYCCSNVEQKWLFTWFGFLSLILSTFFSLMRVCFYPMHTNRSVSICLTTLRHIDRSSIFPLLPCATHSSINPISILLIKGFWSSAFSSICVAMVLLAFTGCFPLYETLSVLEMLENKGLLWAWKPPHPTFQFLAQKTLGARRLLAFFFLFSILRIIVGVSLPPLC